uniref:Alternative protein LOC400986 n=1 Tax=Homo sapiens TaxID=9606 RepID=L8E763_HUMAN|nr:alternative protein LOC400986 [Homo sapiens]
MWITLSNFSRAPVISANTCQLVPRMLELPGISFPGEELAAIFAVWAAQTFQPVGF